MKKKVLLTSICTIALCLCLIAGSTFALFTTSDSVNVAVTAGKVELTANLDSDSMKTWSLYETEADARFDGLFNNGGTAKITDEANVVIERMTPGDVAKFMIDVENFSNVAVQYRVRMISNGVEGVKDLTEALVITAYIDGMVYPVTGTENATIWKYIDSVDTTINDIWVTVSFPNHDKDGSKDNQFQEAQANMTFIVEAVQGNAYDFVVATSEEDFFDSNGYFKNGVFSGEGATIDVTGTNGYVSGDVTLSNVTVDGSNMSYDNLGAINIFDDGENTTLILTEGTTVVSREDALTVFAFMSPEGEDVTMMVDNGAKLVATGSDACILYVQGWAGSEFNLVLNSSAAECLEMNDGANGFVFEGNDGDTLIVNIYARNLTEMEEYLALVDAVDTTIICFVDGTYWDTFEYN